MRLIGLCLIIAGVASAKTLVKRASEQNPKVFSALDQLRGGSTKHKLEVDEIQELFYSVRPGEDFPLLAEVPKDVHVDCASFHQPGFYADVDTGRCQLFHRCDINGNLTSFLCPNETLFNQITLVCDWWFNIDCAQTKQFYDYSNSRLYQEGSPLLDDEPNYVMEVTGAVQSNGNEKRAKRHENSVAR
ncbi:U-scoloptoxin(01)-Er1a-like [Paramacrobiotus metropolitanus]|uniref:U-scoloptoxin(01)-Er1a-like n=1 Tax=Paramacrobiotus metropolitanus TaxID=2943436 RepID=UPI002445ACE9|nr:U-scoloptoxin(01)-Er1a-like [Paramacrobiotus metropolitanus]